MTVRWWAKVLRSPPFAFLKKSRNTTRPAAQTFPFSNGSTQPLPDGPGSQHSKKLLLPLKIGAIVFNKVVASARTLFYNIFRGKEIMKLLKWLSVTDRFYKIYLDKQLAPFEINSSQYMFLIKICHSPGVLQDSLNDIFYIHPSNIVRTIAALEKQGMITRSPSDEDKRTCKLYPTDRALSVIDEIQAVCEKTEALLLQGIQETDQALFLDLLMRAGKNITAELHIERKDDTFHD